MDADYDIFEIVAVTREFRLIDAESYQRRYCTSHGQPLAPGYYVVKWPEHIRARRFNEHALFHGPFKSREEAQAAIDWICQVRECVLKMSSGISSVAAPDYSQMKLKKASA
ncbi:MAG: hypothetical protein ACXWT4_03220 [Methylobacter sp.]